MVGERGGVHVHPGDGDPAQADRHLRDDGRAAGQGAGLVRHQHQRRPVRPPFQRRHPERLVRLPLLRLRVGGGQGERDDRAAAGTGGVCQVAAGRLGATEQLRRQQVEERRVLLQRVRLPADGDEQLAAPPHPLQQRLPLAGVLPGLVRVEQLLDEVLLRRAGRQHHEVRPLVGEPVVGHLGDGIDHGRLDPPAPQPGAVALPRSARLEPAAGVGQVEAGQPGAEAEDDVHGRVAELGAVDFHRVGHGGGPLAGGDIGHDRQGDAAAVPAGLGAPPQGEVARLDDPLHRGGGVGRVAAGRRREPVERGAEGEVGGELGLLGVVAIHLQLQRQRGCRGPACGRFPARTTAGPTARAWPPTPRRRSPARSRSSRA